MPRRLDLPASVRRGSPGPAPPEQAAARGTASRAFASTTSSARESSRVERRCRSGEPSIGRLDGVEGATALRDVVEEILEDFTPVEIVEPLVLIPPLARLGSGGRFRP